MRGCCGSVECAALYGTRIYLYFYTTNTPKTRGVERPGERERGESGHVSSVKRMLPGWRRSKRQSVGGEWKEEKEKEAA